MFYIWLLTVNPPEQMAAHVIAAAATGTLMTPKSIFPQRRTLLYTDLRHARRHPSAQVLTNRNCVAWE
jgi:hypothetical protein